MPFTQEITLVSIATNFILFTYLSKGNFKLTMENLVLRQQLATVSCKKKRPRLLNFDRFIMLLHAYLFKDWKSVIIIVQPQTLIRWQRKGLKLYWRWKCRKKKPGRPRISKEVRDLIKKISSENSSWGTPKIQEELALLGHDVADSTVAKYRVKQTKPPSQTWRTFLKNHMANSAAIDFFTVYTIKFRILFCFIVLSHDRRKIIHFNVTEHPTAEWTIQQIREAFPYDEAPKYLLRDRDSIYSEEFREKVKNMGIEQVPSAPHSPWQNPYVERVIGTIRRECLDHMIIFNEKHFRWIMKEFIDYYHNVRPHQSLEKNSPVPRRVDPPENGKVISIPRVGGLHHEYKRAA